MNTHVSGEAFPVQQQGCDDVAPRPYADRLRAGEPRKCQTCKRRIDPRSKRHTCAACTQRKCRGAETGAACEACGHRDRRVLRLLRLADRMVTACGNCAALAGRRELTLEQLHGEVVDDAA